MKLIKKTDEKLVFRTKIDNSLANAIRRAVYLIPVHAVDEVEISRNDSPLYDETLAHRIGLVPIKVKGKKKGERLKFKLSTKKEGYVYAESMKGDFEIPYPKIPLTLLSKDQELKISGETKMGLGKDHAKFLPGILTFRRMNEITIPKKLKDKILKNFPNLNLVEKGQHILFRDDGETTAVDFVEGLASKEKEKCEVIDTEEVIFTIESFGQMSAEEIFKESIKVLESELKSVKI